MKWGLIGASTIAREWMIDAIRDNGGDIVALMSTSARRGGEFAAATGIPHAVTSLDELFGHQPDAVYISTTNQRHCEQVLAAVRYRAHVLCEKPLALTLGDAEAMVTACEGAGLVMATNHHLRHAATHQEIRRQIRRGALGAIHAVRVFHAAYLPAHLQGWRIKYPEAGAGVVLDITVHDADTLAFLLDEYPRTVTTRTGNHGMAGAGMEDAAMGIWEFPSGIMAFTHEGFTLPHATTGLEIHGTQASLYADNVMTQKPLGRVVLKRGGVDLEIPIVAHNLYARGVAQFVAAVGGGPRPGADGWAGVRSLAVALASLASAHTGRTVVVDYGGGKGIAR